MFKKRDGININLLISFLIGFVLVMIIFISSMETIFNVENSKVIDRSYNIMYDTRMPVGFADGSDIIIDMNDIKTLSYDLDDNFKPCNGKIILKDDNELEIINISDVVNRIYDFEINKARSLAATEIWY